MSIEKTLEERGSRYGVFLTHAYITQVMKQIMRKSPSWSGMSVDQQESLEMIAHKMGRIVNGDPNYVDSWTDIVGYARLVEQRLIADKEAAARQAGAEEAQADEQGDEDETADNGNSDD